MDEGTTHCEAPDLLVLDLEVAIRDFQDHATFREKSVNTGLVRQSWEFPLFDPLKLIKLDVILGWFVCLTVSMVTTSKAAGLEKILHERKFLILVLYLGNPERTPLFIMVLYSGEVCCGRGQEMIDGWTTHCEAPDLLNPYQLTGVKCRIIYSLYWEGFPIPRTSLAHCGVLAVRCVVGVARDD